MAERIGIDVGGVIIDAIANDGTDTDLRGDDFMRAKAIDGAVAAIQRLVTHYGSSNIYIVSKCGIKMETRTQRWMEGNEFFARTGMESGNVRFCKERPQKAVIARELGLTVFIDDRIDVLEAMSGVVARRYLFGVMPDIGASNKGMIRVSGWAELLDELLLV